MHEVVKHVIRMTIAGVVFAAASSLAAPTYPTRPISLIVPQPPGGVVDAMSRMWANYAARELGQPVVVENRGGAGGVIAVRHFLTQPDDGYTVLAAGVSQMVLNQFTYHPLPYDPTRDVKGVSMLISTPFVLAASPQSGIKTFEDLIVRAKANPEMLNYGQPGTGGSGHLVMEMLQQQVGIKMTDVPYAGEAAGATGLMGGQIDVMAPTMPTAVPLAKGGRIVPLLVLGNERNADLPGVRTSHEVGLEGFAGIGWFALEVRPKVPPEIVDRLYAVTQSFLKDPEVVAKLKGMQLELLPGPKSAVEERIKADTTHWQKVLKDIKFAPK